MLLVLPPLAILLDHLLMYPIPLSTLPFAIPICVAFVSLFSFSHEISKTVIIPIMLLLIGFCVVFPSTLLKGIEVYPCLIGTLLIVMGVAATIIVVALSHGKQHY